MAGSHLKLEIEGRLGAGSARNSPTSPFQGLLSLKQVWVSLEMSKRASKWLQKAGSSGVQVRKHVDSSRSEVLWLVLVRKSQGQVGNRILSTGSRSNGLNQV